MTSALTPLYDAVYDALRDGSQPSAALQALGVTYVGDRPAGHSLPYVLVTGDTETEDVFFSDATDTSSDATLTLTVWADDDGTTREIADAIIATLSVPLVLAGGHEVIRARLDLNSRLPAAPNEPQGRALRFRYTASPVTR